MSTRSMKASFIFDMHGNIRRKAREFGNSFSRMGASGERELGRVGRAADAANRKLNAGLIRGAKVGALALGAAAGLSARRMFTLEERLERLGIAAGKTPKEMMAVRDSVNEIANLNNIRIDPGEIFSGIEAFTEATGEFDLADQMKEQMALAIQATGAGGAEIGQLMASIFQKFDIKTPEEMLAALDTLTVQGKAGAVELRNLASLGPKVYSAFGRVGQGGIAGLAEASGLMQKFKEGVGSPEEAATVFENVINNLYNPTKMNKLRKAGVKLEGDNGELLGPADMMKAVIESAGGKDLNLAKVFDAEAMRGFSILSKEFRSTGGFASLDAMSGIRGDGSVISEDSARMAEVGNSQGQSLLNNVNDRIEDNLMEPLTELTKSLNALLDKGIKFTAEDAMNVAAGGAAAFGIAKAGLWMMGGGRRGARGGKAGGAGGLLNGAMGVQPVFVTNMPGGGMFGDGPGLDRANGRRGGRAGRGAGRLGRAGRSGLGMLGRGAGALSRFSGYGTLAYLGYEGVKYGFDQLEDYNAPIQRLGHQRRAEQGILPPTRDEIAMANRERAVAQMSHGAAPVHKAVAPAPATLTTEPTIAELSTQLEAFIAAQEDTREETQVSGDKVVRAVNGLKDKVTTPRLGVPLGGGILMSQ